MKKLHEAALALMVLAIASAGQAQAGANTARLKCSGSVGGKEPLQVSGTIPASMEGLDLELHLGAASARLTDQDADARVVEDFGRKVFTLSIVNRVGGSETILYAVPNSLTVRYAQNQVDARFSARLTTPKPGLPGGPASSNDVIYRALLTCEYHYSI